MTPPAYSSLARPLRTPIGVLARVFGVDGISDGIDCARVGGLIGLVSGIAGLVGGLIGIVSGVLGVVGGILGILSSGLLGIVAGGVLGVVLGGVVGSIGSGVFVRDWNFRGSFGILRQRTAGCDAGLAVSGLMATALWRIMRVASGLMPPAAGRRWLAEAESFLFEAPAGIRNRAIPNYLLTAPQLIAAGWTRALARRSRLTGSEPAARQGNVSGDPGS